MASPWTRGSRVSLSVVLAPDLSRHVGHIELDLAVARSAQLRQGAKRRRNVDAFHFHQRLACVARRSGTNRYPAELGDEDWPQGVFRRHDAMAAHVILHTEIGATPDLVETTRNAEPSKEGAWKARYN